MSLGRPAMRAKERRHTTNLLRSHAIVMQIISHAIVMQIMVDEGIQADVASRIAYDIVTTAKRRKAIWGHNRFATIQNKASLEAK
jgi:hypothetical protein